MHALPSGMDVKAHAESIGRIRSIVHDKFYAAEVGAVPHMWNDVSNCFRPLTAIHTAPRWLCRSLSS
jgi:hypothetical protein